jgi:hypothetical protein
MRTLFAAAAASGGDASSAAGAAVFDAEEALFAKGCSLEGMVERYCGEGVYRLLGPDPSRLAAAAEAAGFEVLEEGPEVERVEVELSGPPAYEGSAEEAVKAWLAEERIRFVEERQGSARSLRPSPRDARKGMILGAELRGTGSDGRFSIALSLGPKARLAPRLSRMGSPAARAVETRIAAIAIASAAREAEGRTRAGSED